MTSAISFASSARASWVKRATTAIVSALPASAAMLLANASSAVSVRRAVRTALAAAVAAAPLRTPPTLREL